MAIAPAPGQMANLFISINSRTNHLEELPFRLRLTRQLNMGSIPPTGMRLVPRDARPSTGVSCQTMLHASRSIVKNAKKAGKTLTSPGLARNIGARSGIGPDLCDRTLLIVLSLLNASSRQ